MQLPVPHQSARKKSDLAQNLEAVAGTDNQFSVPRFLHHTGHDWGEARNRAAAQIIAKGKTARQNDGVESSQRRFLVPDVFRTNAGDPLQRRQTILIAIRTWKLDYREFHWLCFFPLNFSTPQPLNSSPPRSPQSPDSTANRGKDHSAANQNSASYRPPRSRDTCRSAQNSP